MAARASALERLRRAVQDRTGLDFTGTRGGSFVATLERAARAAGARDAEAHAQALLAAGDDLQPLVEELTVGETWFFREPAQWAFVEQVVLPDARLRHGGRDRLHAWSAGCSTGEEPYTLAIVLSELGLRDRVRIAATDLDAGALARARRAEFSLWSLRGDVQGRARRHLSEADGRYVLDPAVAAMVRFFPLNLAGPDYPSVSRGLHDLDLVLCRNVLIYLDDAHVADTVARLHESLAPGGWLLAGAADPPLARLAAFEVRSGPFGLAYRRRERPVAVPAGRRAVPAALRPAARVHAARATPPAPRAAHGATSPTPPPPARRDDLAAARHLLDAGRLADALAELDALLARRPLEAAAHFERAVVLTELGRRDGAEEACRRALYLSRGHPFVHFFTGVLRLGRGDRAGAAGAFRTAATLAARRPPGEEVPLSHGMTAGALAEAARLHLRRLQGDGPASA